ncbi:RTA1 like protein-domain-containing protein [Xylariales sp. PMI_506]|nr:RTA1 like protein-domain-containing protein [Xylariales sp. PMI_506]
MSDTSSFDFKLYRYDLSLPAAIIGVTVFAILSTLHVWRIYRHRSYYFTAFTIGGFFQSIGYAGRIWSHFEPLAIGGFVVQAILILVAPALYAASIYMILGRLIVSLDAQSLSVIPVVWVTRIFVIGDVLSFLFQSGGGGIQAAGTLELYDIGEKIIIVGLFIQIAMFSFFLATTVLFHYRYMTYSMYGSSRQTTIVPWQRHLRVLYAVSAIILIRSIFRVVEYLQGNQGYLISHEIFLYMFDALLMATVMAIFLVYYVHNLGTSPVGKRGSGREMLNSSDSEIRMDSLPAQQ